MAGIGGRRGEPGPHMAGLEELSAGVPQLDDEEMHSCLRPRRVWAT